MVVVDSFGVLTTVGGELGKSLADDKTVVEISSDISWVFTLCVTIKNKQTNATIKFIIFYDLIIQHFIIEFLENYKYYG